MKRTFESILVERCAPTLAGLKPANLFHYTAEDRASLHGTVAFWSQTLHPYGITVQLVKECPQASAALVYVYRRHWLSCILSIGSIRRFLASVGYDVTCTPSEILAQLALRLEEESEFPHEIGVFLGYPLEDVVGFIKNKGKNYTCKGCWKSYGDPIQAGKRFARYRECMAAYRRLYADGIPILQLVAAA